ncbi:MAG: hypothetical protein MZU97_21725 [Bacillus subtilis]|nr:hypothetical protein [Bacillus subtilis]
MNIITTIENFVGPLIAQGIGILEGLPVIIQGAALLGLALFAVVGVFVFLKKFIKLFIVLGILGGVGYLVWTQTTIIQDLLSGIMP